MASEISAGVDHQRDLVFAGEKSLRDRRDRRVDVHPRAGMAGTTASRPFSSTVMLASTASRSISAASPATSE